MTFPFPFSSPFINAATDVLIYADSDGTTTDNSSFSFSSMALGAADADRNVFVVITWAGNVTISSATLDANAITLLSKAQGSTGGAAVGMIAWPTGTTGTVAITLSGTAASCHVSTYYSHVADLIIRDYDAKTAAATTATASNIRVRSGGFILSGIYLNSSAETVSLSYNGTDTEVEDYSAIAESFTHKHSAVKNITETAIVNDVVASGSGSAQKGVACISICPDYTPGYYEYIIGIEKAAASTTYTFDNVPFGPAGAGRELIIGVSWIETVSGSVSISSATINGVAATIVEQITNTPAGGCGHIRSTSTTGTSGTVSITFSNTVAGVGIGVYQAFPASTTPVDTVTANASATSVTAADVSVSNGGVLFAAGYKNNNQVITFTYNGIDTIVQDDSLTTHTAMAFASCRTTETVTTNDVVATTAGSTNGRIACASFL